MNSGSNGGSGGDNDRDTGRVGSRDGGRDNGHGAGHDTGQGGLHGPGHAAAHAVPHGTEHTGVAAATAAAIGSGRSEIRLEGARPDVVAATALEPTPMILRGGATQEYWFEEGCFIAEWLNSPEDPSLSIARARVLPGVTTRLHRLVGVAERYVILEGIGRVELVGPDRELKVADHYVSDVEPGDVVVIPPRVSQRISNIGETDLVFLALCTPRFTRAAYEDTES